jgi:site-specific DNA recombinase
MVHTMETSAARAARTAQVAGQAARERAVLRLADAPRARRDGRSWQGEDTAIYCRISHVKDQDQTGVDRQERICRRIVKRLGLVVSSRNVFVDNNRSAWQRNRKRPGWDELLEAARSEGIRHIVVYHPDRLMRQPRDLEELLAIADEHGITLHGEANHRDLSDPDDRFFLRIEVAHACRSSDDTSRRLKDAMVDRARDGLPHTTSSRSYGYEKNGMSIIPEEAEIVRWIFQSFLDGMTPFLMAADLNHRGVRTSHGQMWTINAVLRVLDSRHVAGILVFRGTEIGPGAWPAIIDPAMWAEVRERRSYRSAVARVRYAPKHFYLCRGLLWCAKCGVRMAGKPENGHPAYICRNFNNPDKSQRCSRKVKGEILDGFVKDAAIDLLERLDVSGQHAATVLSEEDDAAVAADRAELVELKEAWDNQEIRTAEYRQMRKRVEDRIKKFQAKTIVRPAAEVLDGMTGPDARQTWDAHERADNWDRLNAVLRFLFAAVRIRESAAPAGRFDYGRIDIEQNEI